MAGATEKSLDRLLRDKVKSLGGWSLKLETSFISGIPDRLLLFPGGRVAFAEIKTPGEKPRAIQKAIIKKLIKMGFDVYIVDSPEVINQIIKEYGNQEGT